MLCPCVRRQGCCSACDLPQRTWMARLQAEQQEDHATEPLKKRKQTILITTQNWTRFRPCVIHPATATNMTKSWTTAHSNDTTTTKGTLSAGHHTGWADQKFHPLKRRCSVKSYYTTQFFGSFGGEKPGSKIFASIRGIFFALARRAPRPPVLAWVLVKVRAAGGGRRAARDSGLRRAGGGRPAGGRRTPQLGKVAPPGRPCPAIVPWPAQSPRLVFWRCQFPPP